MNSQPRPPLKSLDAALAELLAHAQPLLGSQLVDTFEADGRVLAEALVAALQVPPFDNSAMDGYALRAADLSGPELALPVSQRIAAGSIGEPLVAGTAARIFTGAAVPAGADAVVMQEECSLLEDGRVRINAAVKPGQNIRQSGEDMQLGSTVLTAGTRLGPAELGLAASMGCANLAVARRPRVALFSTGDELVMPGDVAPQDLPAGSIYNSNRFFLRAMLQRLGCEVQDLGIVPDSYEATVAALQAAAQQSDLVLTSGGVSVGEEDHIKPAVQALGSLDLWAIAVKPGKPFAYGRLGQAHFIGLPGNPVSSFVTFALLVRPFLLRLQGVQAPAPQAVDMRADFDWPRADKRREFLRVRINAQGGLDRFANQGSGVLTSAVWADGLVDNPEGKTIARGDMVRFLPFAQLLG
ncbi:molybdopterin molybdotransferase MoeA [Comamonas piscis]